MDREPPAVPMIGEGEGPTHRMRPRAPRPGRSTPFRLPDTRLRSERDAMIPPLASTVVAWSRLFEAFGCALSVPPSGSCGIAGSYVQALFASLSTDTPIDAAEPRRAAA